MLLRSILASAVLLIVLLTVAAQTVAVVTAHGKVQKADKETVTFQPRDEGGEFGKAVTLKITGTSRITSKAGSSSTFSPRGGEGRGRSPVRCYR